MLKPRGWLAAIFRADRLDVLLAACPGRFGGICVLPIAPRAAEQATRVVIAARARGRGPLRLLPPLVLHEASGSAYTEAAEAVLRHAAPLSDVCPGWTGIG